MVDYDDLRQAGGLSLLGLDLSPEAINAPTLQIPIVPGTNVPWIEPRRYGPNGPVWDTTDEMYISYDREGNRVLVTVQPTDVWADEFAYQRLGSGKYDSLRTLATNTAGVARQIASGVGSRVGGAVRRVRPSWAGGTGGWPTVHTDREGLDAGDRSGGGARSRREAGGDGATRAHRHAQHRADERGISHRSDTDTAELRVRSHRHCPGCSGHGLTGRGALELVLRLAGAWALGWVGLWAGGVAIDFPEYIGLTSLLMSAAMVFRPVWREYVNGEERLTKGGRR